MKSRFLISTIVLITVIFSSCDPNSVINNSTANYWERNALTHLQLKDKVKTLITNNGTQTTQFNASGFVTSITSNSDGYSSVATYTYASNGQLLKIETVNTDPINGSTTSTMNYEYNSTGKYIPLSVMHMYEVGLTPNLKAMSYDSGRTDYVFNGDNLLIIMAYQSVMGETKDTTIVKFSGKYPVSSSTSWSFTKDISYADNGMFLTYTEGFQGVGYMNTRIYNYKTDDEYMLLGSVNYIDTYGTQTTTNTTTYTYNDHKNLIKEEDSNGIQEYTDYVYDSHGNWTSRIYSSQYAGSDKTTNPAETRTIIYWTDTKTAK